MTRRGGRESLREGKWDREGLETARDGTASCLVEVFHFGDIGNA